MPFEAIAEPLGRMGYQTWADAEIVGIVTVFERHVELVVFVDVFVVRGIAADVCAIGVGLTWSNKSEFLPGGGEFLAPEGLEPMGE